MTKYFQFDWTATRKEFWLTTLAFLGIIVVAVLIGAATQPQLFQANQLTAAELIVHLGLFIPYIAVYKARLNDAGWSGWWQLFPVLNIVVAGFFASKDEDNPYKNG